MISFLKKKNEEKNLTNVSINVICKNEIDKIKKLWSDLTCRTLCRENLPL